MCSMNKIKLLLTELPFEGATDEVCYEKLKVFKKESETCM
jgi:hypothetical protein